MRFFTLFLLFAIGCVGCGISRSQSDTTAANASSSFENLSGATWILTSFGPAADRDSVLQGTGITATFSDREDRLSGSAGCNRYFGSYKQDDDQLSLSQMGATRKACPRLIMKQEQAYLAALKSVHYWQRNDDKLDLMNSESKRLLRFNLQEEQAESKDNSSMRPQPVGQTFVFDCTPPESKAFSFTVRTGPGELAIWLPDRFAGDPEKHEQYLVLGQVRAASGAKYEGDGVTVWNKGDEAMLTVHGERFSGCTSNPQRAVWEEAKRRGVDFRAMGNEPGWYLELREGERIQFTYAYGEHKVTMPAPSPDTSGAPTIYRAETEAHHLTVGLQDESCKDDMNGREFPITVRVQFNGNVYRGCGRWLH